MGPVITIQKDYGASTDIPTHHLDTGQVCTFGRGCPGGPAVDIGLAPDGDTAVPRQAGVIEACGTYWMISNSSRTQTYLVEHLQPVRGFVQVSPGETRMPIPFELSRVKIRGRRGESVFLVMAPDHVMHTAAASTGPRTERPVTLDPASRYFQVLVALCEPQLDERNLDQHIPTVNEVARRLDVPATTVNGQLDYLITYKLPDLQQLGQGSGVGWRVQALTQHVLRYGLVTADHLRLLPPHH
jgi:hypothetical protein